MRFSSPVGRERGRGATLQRRPGQLVFVGFVGAIAVGTLLLLLPISASGQPASFMEVFFTATSAVCVTGLIVTDTPVFWSGFGEAVILVLIQIGGLGVMTVASLLGVLVSRRRRLARWASGTLILPPSRDAWWGIRASPPMPRVR